MVPQAGAIAYRPSAAGVEVLVVSPKHTTDAWMFPKGHLELGERAHDAAVRELEEEAGVSGRVVDVVCPPLRFRSRSELVEVQYFVVAATEEAGSGDGRQKRWVALGEVGATLTHDDARALLQRAAPLMRRLVHQTSYSDGKIDPALRELLIVEYQHAAESLLRNEEDGERRVRFFLSLAGAAAGVVVLVRGDSPQAVNPDEVEPLLAVLLGALTIIGYTTFLRVVERNLASERYKRGLNRIRRAFVPSSSHEGNAYLAFDPYEVRCRRRPSWRSFGKGGWLETVSLVEAGVVGGLASVLIPSGTWWLEGLLAAAAGIATWMALVTRAARSYDRR